MLRASVNVFVILRSLTQPEAVSKSSDKVNVTDFIDSKGFGSSPFHHPGKSLHPLHSLLTSHFCRTWMAIGIRLLAWELPYH